MNKAISTPIAIVIIILCAFLVGGVVVYQYYGIPKREEKAQENETVIWKTYTNKENGYEIKYPSNWRMEVYEKAHELARTQGAVRWHPSWVSPEKIKLVIEINVFNNLEGYSIPMALFDGAMTCEDVEINDLTFCKFVKKSEKPNIADFLAYAISKDSKIYFIGIYNWLPENEVQTEFKIFNEMVSTFRFLE